MFKKLEREIRKLKEKREVEEEVEENDLVIKRYRELIMELGVNDIRDYLDGKDEEMRDNFISNASSVYKNHTFKTICEYFIKKYTKETIDDALSCEDLQKGRMVLASIMIIYREFNNLNTMHEERLKNKDEYDNNDII